MFLTDLNKIRAIFPEYKKLDDYSLIYILYKKYYSDFSVDEYYHKIGLANYISYSTKVKFQTVGSWTECIIFLAISGIIIYALLNIMKETLLYLFVGKKFSWNWVGIRSRANIKITS